MKRVKRRIILLLILTVNFASGICQQNNISITVTNIRSDRGLIRLALYDHEDQFPNDPAHSFDFNKTLDEEGCLEITLLDIPPGTYAISILDDEDENDRMNYNILRMPKEGYGFSNNVKPKLKSPPFEECCFRVDTEITYLEIQVQYHRKKS